MSMYELIKEAEARLEALRQIDGLLTAAANYRSDEYNGFDCGNYAAEAEDQARALAKKHNIKLDFYIGSLI